MLKHTRAIKLHFTYGVADLIKCLSLRHINILTPDETLYYEKQKSL
jgi:hypothetical protein